MKKNILTIVIIALSLVNVVLSAMIVFVVVPTSNQTNNLLRQVAGIINIELETGDEEAPEIQVDLKNVEPYNIDEELTINLKKSPNDNTEHYGLVTVSLTINTKSKDYKKLYPLLTTTESWVKSAVYDVVSQYTKEEAHDDITGLEKEILTKLKEKYESQDFIVGVVFSTRTFN